MNFVYFFETIAYMKYKRRNKKKQKLSPLTVIMTSTIRYIISADKAQTDK